MMEDWDNARLTGTGREYWNVGCWRLVTVATFGFMVESVKSVPEM